MKKYFFLTPLLSIMLLVNTNAQTQSTIRLPLLGEEAPSFAATSTTGIINFPGDFSGKWKILFSHPADFTPVCTSEIIELANFSDEFYKLNTSVVVISTDGLNSHNEWINSIEKMWYKNNNPVKIKFPIISDNDLVISKLYGMIQPAGGDRKDIRGVFIIGPENKVRAMFFYPGSVGRNMNEIMRTLIALQQTDTEQVLTPANWKPGEDVLLHAPANITEASDMILTNDPQRYNYDWYLWFQKQDKK